MGPLQVVPKMTIVKKNFITWCPETLGDNTRLFSTWWMRPPWCPLNCVCSHPGERICGPYQFSALYSHGNDCSVHWQTHTQARTLCGGNRSWLRSTNGKADQWELSQQVSGLYASLGETANEKARGPGQEVFFPPFQGKMPRAIKTASSKWMEKADVPYSGLREVRVGGGGDAFRNALRDM